MQNPQMHSSMITPRQMHSYDRKTNETWNMQEYKTPQIYQDPKLQIQKRKWEVQEKGRKTDKYETKRGFYMDYQLKVSKSVPAASKHGKQEPWTFPKAKKLAEHIKMDQNLVKYSYLQRIEMEQKNRKKPGICTYSLQKSLKEQEQANKELKKKKFKDGDKRFYYENTQDLSNNVPGPGNYCPHDEVQKIKSERHDYRYWIGKHQKQSDFFRKRDLKKPTANTYNPVYQSFQSFELTKRIIDISPKKSIEHKNWFGSDSKFEYTRPVKKKIKQVRPSPASYNTKIEWNGKDKPSDKKKKKRKDWSEAIWKGPSNQSSIYH